MKKIISFAVCIAAVGAINAQVAVVNQASKLAGKVDKIGEARELINQAIENPETADAVDTWFTAGNIEFKAYDTWQGKLALDPNTQVDPNELGTELINGYNYFVKAFPLDQIPDEKGKVKAKHTKKMASAIAGHLNDYFNVGSALYNEKNYADAAKAFRIYADMPDMKELDKLAPVLTDEQRSIAYFNSGIMANSASNLDEAIYAFEKACETNYHEPDAWIYAIATWQNKMKADSTVVEKANEAIYRIAKDGYERFGIQKPTFINNMINYLVNNNQMDEALATTSAAIDQYPEAGSLYSLRAYVYSRMGNEEAALKDYRTVGNLPDVDFESLSRAARHIALEGQKVYNTIEGSSDEMMARRQDVKNNYFQPALEIAKRAQELNPTDSSNNYIIDSIEYNLSLIK